MSDEYMNNMTDHEGGEPVVSNVLMDFLNELRDLKDTKMDLDQEYHASIHHGLNMIQALMNKLMFIIESRKEEIDEEFKTQFHAMEIQLQHHIETERIARNTLADLTLITRDTNEMLQHL